eukprot:TRINITY_DN325_c0_g1_i1.p1 TRINITY_DN325_c0_g1~~TRINITY_DN325_c0_g1_i1.p1  ORF type:complete len:148 (-),score=46.43 TRINITY_DN325_c0_g1_i1:189-632(-)
MYHNNNNNPVIVSSFQQNTPFSNPNHLPSCPPSSSAISPSHSQQNNSINKNIMNMNETDLLNFNQKCFLSSTPVNAANQQQTQTQTIPPQSSTTTTQATTNSRKESSQSGEEGDLMESEFSDEVSYLVNGLQLGEAPQTQGFMPYIS